MSDRVTRGTPSFDSRLWDTGAIPAELEPPIPHESGGKITAPVPEAPSTGFYIVLVVLFVLVVILACNGALWLMQPAPK